MICDFIYTKEGLRVPSGDAVITITGPDGVTRTLVVVRSGKGRSRLDRWSDKPRPDGVVGEINTRDLQEWMELSNSREIPGKITVDGVELDVILDSEAMMGRAGRQSEGFREYLAGLNPESQRAAALLMIKGSPYGTEHTEDFRDGVDAALETLSEDDVRALIESGEMNFLAHCSEEFIEKHHKTLSSEELSAKIACEPVLFERVASVKRVSDAIEVLSRYGSDVEAVLYNKNVFSSRELEKIASRGSIAAAEALIVSNPAAALNISFAAETDELARLLVGYQIIDKLQNPEREELAELLIRSLTSESYYRLAEASKLWTGLNNHGDISTIKSLNELRRAEILTRVLSNVTSKNAGLLREVAFKVDSVMVSNTWDLGVTIHPGEIAAREAALKIGASLFNQEKPDKVLARAAVDVLLGIGSRAGEIEEIAFWHRDGLGRACSNLPMGKLLGGWDHRPTPGYVVDFMEHIDLPRRDSVIGWLERDDAAMRLLRAAGKDVIQDSIDGMTEDKLASGSLKRVSERALVLSLLATDGQVDIEDALYNSGITPAFSEEDRRHMSMHRPSYGLREVLAGRGDQWLLDLSEKVANGANNRGGFSRLVDERDGIFDPENLSMLVTVVSMAAGSSQNGSVQREVLDETAEIAGVKRNIMGFRKSAISFVETDGPWSAPIIDDNSSDHAERPELRRRAEAALIAHAVRLGVAVGTQDEKILESLASSGRDSLAGPAAGLRMSPLYNGDAWVMPKVESLETSNQDSGSGENTFRTEIEKAVRRGLHPVTMYGSTVGVATERSGVMQHLASTAVLEASSITRSIKHVKDVENARLRRPGRL